MPRAISPDPPIRPTFVRPELPSRRERWGAPVHPMDVRQRRPNADGCLASVGRSRGRVSGIYPLSNRFKDGLHETLSSRVRHFPVRSCRTCFGAGHQRRADCVDRRHRQPGRHRCGNLAKSTSHNDEVKKFAQTMVTDHTGVNKSATDLVTKLKVTPEDNETSKSLQEGGQKNLASAQDAQGRRVRQGLHRSRSRLSPAGSRCRRQDADSVGEERRAQGAAGQGPAGIRRSPRAREAPAGLTREVSRR